MNAGAQLPVQVAAALARGDTIQAIRLLREAGGQGLKEALVTLQAHAATQQQARTGTRPAGQRDPLNGGASASTKQMQQPGHGVGQPTARQAMEALQRNVAMQAGKARADALALRGKAERPPTVVEGDHGGHASVVLALVAALAATAWWWLGG